MNKNFHVIFASIVISILFLCNNGCKNPSGTAVKAPVLAVGIQNSPSNALVIIANDQKMFDTTKVNVQVKEFSAGKLALQALLGSAGDLDVAVSAETPVVLSLMGGNQIRVIAQIVNASNECRMVVRRDGNLNTPETYFSKKRIITTSQGGSPEWLTYNFLKRYNLTKDKVEINPMAPENMPVALSNKAVDGICIFDPFARLAEKELGDAGITFLNESMKSYYILSAKDKTIADKKALLQAFLEGLKKAENFMKTNPDVAQQIIARRTKLDLEIVKSTWTNYDFGVGLDQALSSLCNQEAQWAIESGKYPQGTVIPDFGKVLDGELIR